MSLTNRQRAFVLEYVKDYNATQAAIRAGYSEKGARVRGSELLANRNIKEAIEVFFQENAMSASEVLSRLTIIARGKLTDSDVNSQLRALENLAKYHNLTNTTQVRTWKDDAIDAIKNGTIDYDILRETIADLGESESLADELFRLAGVPIISEVSTEAD